MFGHRFPDTDQGLLISGGQSNEGSPFRVIIGHGASVMPFLCCANLLTPTMSEAEIHETCVTDEGIALNVKAVNAFKMGSDIAASRLRQGSAIFEAVRRGFQGGASTNATDALGQTANHRPSISR